MLAGAIVHTLFDLLAALSSLAMTLFVYKWRLTEVAETINKAGFGYVVALIIGAMVGGYGFGTANLLISGIAGIGRSIAGALFGAITAIELFKLARGISGSTGLLFVPAFSTSVAVGRLGCFFSGLGDHTYGVATGLPWGVNLGDGVMRHPVQLYEAACMAGFLIFALVMLARRQQFFMANGFYLMVVWYGAQRFVWEFLKPYGKLIGPFNIFHFLCAGLILYGLWMILSDHKRA